MSEIKTKSQNWRVEKKDDVIALYEGALENQNLKAEGSKIGMEMELNVYNLGDLSPLTQKQSQGFICDGIKREALNINTEPSASTLEIITDPYTPENFSDLVAQINQRFEQFWSIGRQRAMIPSPFGYLPHAKPSDHDLVENERYKALWGSGRTDRIEAHRSFLDPSIQVSVSYKDYDHLLRMIRLSVVLEPFLMLTTEADPGFYEGARVDGSPRTRILKRRGRNGGIPDFYLKAKSGEELMHEHIDFTLNNPLMFVRFDHDGKLTALPDGEWTSFSDLESKNLGQKTLLNYRQAQSMSWRRTVNIAEIRNAEGTLFGHRAEISSLFCTGLQHQRVTASILACLIAYCRAFHDNIKALALDFGIDFDDLYGCKSLLDQNFENAYNHHGRYHDLPFGTKTLREFALEFSSIARVCLTGWRLNLYSGPLMHILTSGRPDWMVYREIFEDLDQVKTYMKSFHTCTETMPELIDSGSCADMVKDKIKAAI